MKKKIYISPLMDVLEFSTKEATMQHLFGPASAPGDPHTSAPRRRTEVF